MKYRWMTWLLIAFLFLARDVSSQEEEKTPAQKTREAMEKFSKFPSVVGERLEAARDKVKGLLQDALGDPPAKKSEVDLLTVPKKPQKTDRPHYSPIGKRDPFVPVPTQAPRPAKKALSPLEQFELGQLKLVGIVWDAKQPRAMVEDASGLGYIIRVGTPIGANDGKVKAIRPDEIVIEESYVDFYGARKSREFNMKLPPD